jgi:uncharacterized membrane protein (UPF0182 family)
MKRMVLIVIAVLLLLFLVGASLSGLYTDWLWFGQVQYSGVFLTAITTKLWLGVAGAALLFFLLWVNLRIARRPTHTPLMFQGMNVLAIPDRHLVEAPVNRMLPVVILLISLFGGLVVGNALWEQLLLYLHPTEFGQKDPLFNNDLGFYVFQFPLLKSLYRLFMLAMGLCVVLSAAVYIFDERVAVTEHRQFIILPRVKRHLLTLLGIMLLAKALSYRLNMYDLLYSPRGVAAGASYTDVHILLPVLWVQMVAAGAAGIGVIWFGLRKGWILAGSMLAVWFGLSLLGALALPAAVQGLKVTPNELNAERRYIERNIAFTRAAYNVDDVDERAFSAEESLTPELLEANQLTIENIRLWDHRPLLSTYAQLQAIRTYYDFHDVDNDRYTIGGEYRQVMLSARELNYEALPSRTWVNERLTYTHGYGVVLSPVNRILREGEPDFLLKDIPPEGHSDLKLTRPEIYYGETVNPYIFVRTKAREFDYPVGDQNEYTHYEGDGGVPVGGWLKRLLWAFRFKSMSILMNTDVHAESRIMIYRRVLDRLQRIAPFLLFDQDPYIVLSEGKLYWICDAYTRTAYYPYSQPMDNFGNYVRNSVKAIVDAYDGTVDFYVAEPNDPIIRSYQKVFPDTFKPLDEMSLDLRRHIRVPKALFQIQAQIYAKYHMTDPEIFYQNEDLWEFPKETYRQDEREMEPYHNIMRLPGEAREQEEFVLMLPFTPQGKHVLRAWMCARNDGDQYGKLLVYNFPKGEQVDGPYQIEARISQNEQIREQLALWIQGGDVVIRGNLLVVPIPSQLERDAPVSPIETKGSLLYVEPVFLQAARGEIPELKRVIVAYGDRIVMERDLERCLDKLFGRESALAKAIQPVPPDIRAKQGGAEPTSTLTRRAWQHLQQAKESYGDDWAKFGQQMKELEQVLKDLNDQANAQVPEP